MRVHNKIEIPEPYKSQIVRDYLGGASLRSLAGKYNFSRDTIGNRLADWGIAIRTNRFDIRHDAFSSITPESMYWAGYLMGDGSVYLGRDGNNWVVNICSKDKEQVESFSAFLDAGNKSIYKTSRNTYIFSATSRQIKKDLEYFGVLPRKSKTARVPNAEVLINRDFWRGMIDSDGCLGKISNRNAPYVSFGSGSRELVVQYTEFLSHHHLFNGNQIYSRKDVENGFWFFVTRCELASDLARFLYQDATVALQRKRATAEMVINFYN